MITKDQARALLHEHTKNQNLRRHMYAVEELFKGVKTLSDALS